MDNWLKKLNSKGIRVTAMRLAVIETIQKTKKALSPLQIFDLTRKDHPHLGLVTVYRTIEILEKEGLIEHLHHFENCQAVIPRGEGHQHVLVCKKCGNVVHFDGIDLSTLLQTINKETGFQVQEHWMQLSGVCPNCKS